MTQEDFKSTTVNHLLANIAASWLNLAYFLLTLSPARYDLMSHNY